MDPNTPAKTPNSLTPALQKRLLTGDFTLADRPLIVGLIKNWNATRMDMFEIKQPEENSIEFYGVIRFYHQDAQQRISTKCIRVASSATTQEVIEALAQRFRPDMKMLTSNYGLYEVHEKAPSRKLDKDERPIIIQLLWTQEMKEGRLTLRNEDQPVPISGGKGIRSGSGAGIAADGTFNPPRAGGNYTFDSDDTEDSGNKNYPKHQDSRTSNNSTNLHKMRDQSGSSSTLKQLTRKLTMTKKSKQNKLAAELRRASMKTGNTPFNVESAVAQQVFKEKPSTAFTRTISNPEAVLKRQREQKVQQRLAKQSRNIKIYGVENLLKNEEKIQNGQNPTNNNENLPFINVQINPIETTKKVILDALSNFHADLNKINLENFLLVRLEIPRSVDENDFSKPISVFNEKYGNLINNKKILIEEMMNHSRPLVKLGEFEKRQRLRNMNNLCIFQLRRVFFETGRSNNQMSADGVSTPVKKINDNNNMRQENNHNNNFNKPLNSVNNENGIQNQNNNNNFLQTDTTPMFPIYNNAAQNQNNANVDDSKSVNFDPNVTPMFLEYIQKGDKIYEHPMVVKNDFVVFGRYWFGDYFEMKKDL